MSWAQKTITLKPQAKGCYLVTQEVLDQLSEIKDYKIGLLTLFIQHTSCAISLNENADPDVRLDMTESLDRVAAEDVSLYRHSHEGGDDMAGHIKSSLVGASLTIPITNGKCALGRWQGIWYMEFRTAVHTRKIVATIQGQRNDGK